MRKVAIIFLSTVLMMSMSCSGGGGGGDVPADDSPDIVKALALAGNYAAIMGMFGGSQFAIEGPIQQCSTSPCTISEEAFNGDYANMSGTVDDTASGTTSYVVTGDETNFTITIASSNPTEYAVTFPVGYPHESTTLTYNGQDYLFQVKTADSTLDGAFSGTVNASYEGQGPMSYNSGDVDCTSTVTNMLVTISSPTADPDAGTVSFGNQQFTITISENTSTTDLPEFMSTVVYDGITYTCYTDTTLDQGVDGGATFTINEDNNMPSCTAQ